MILRIDYLVWSLAIAGLLLLAVAFLSRRIAREAALREQRAAAFAEADAAYETQMANFAESTTRTTSDPSSTDTITGDDDKASE